MKNNTNINYILNLLKEQNYLSYSEYYFFQYIKNNPRLDYILNLLKEHDFLSNSDDNFLLDYIYHLQDLNYLLMLYIIDLLH